MKIVVFGNGCGFGGAQTAFRRLVDFFSAEGHSVGVIGLVGKSDVLPAQETAAFAKRLNNDSWRIIKLNQTFRAAERARQFAPDVFVAVGLAKSATLIARYLPKKTFRVAQDFIFGRRPDDPLLKPLRYVFHALAVQSPSMLGALRAQAFDALPLSWLPCFPDPPQLGFAREERNGRNGVRLGYFGRLAPNKGIDLLLQALASAKLASPVTLDIWGGGSESETLKKLATTLPCQDVVQFKGRYPEGAECARLMCTYDGLVLPSTGLEGLPLILLEAMAYGVPFLTTRVGAIPDCANDDTVLTDPTVDSIRSGLEQFVARASANQFSTSRLQRHYANHFSHEVMASRWREMMSDPKRFFSPHA